MCARACQKVQWEYAELVELQSAGILGRRLIHDDGAALHRAWWRVTQVLNRTGAGGSVGGRVAVLNVLAEVGRLVTLDMPTLLPAHEPNLTAHDHCRSVRVAGCFNPLTS